MNFKDIFKNGMNVDSPTFDISYSNGNGASGNSSATIDLKIFYQPQNPENPNGTDINAVRELARQYLKDNNLYTLPINSEYNVGTGNSLKLTNISAKNIAGTDAWDVSCKFSDKNNSSSNNATELALKNFQFSTQGKTEHITKAKATITSVDYLGGSGYDFQNMIGFNDGEFQGVEVKRPNLTFQRDIWILADNFSWSIVRSLAEFTGSVNADYFYTFEPGTILFTGVSQGQKATLRIGSSSVLYWQISLGFEHNANSTSTFGTYPIYKAGWDYQWYLRNKTIISSDSGKIVTRTPVQVIVNRVYPFREFVPFFGFGFGDTFTEGETFFNG